MDKETLSNYGWIVIAVLVLVVMIALATPFGEFVATAVKSTTQGLFDTSYNALEAANVPGLAMEEQNFEHVEYEMLNAPTKVVDGTQEFEFRSQADISKFKEVKVDGKTVNTDNYQVTEGSTIITFTSDYAKTLENGSHTIEIVSTDGVAKSTFDVKIACATFYGYFINTNCHDDEFLHTSDCYVKETKTLTWDELNLTENKIKYGYGFDRKGNEININNTKIEDRTFYASTLISIVIPSETTTIGSAAFSYCDYLTDIYIPHGVTRMEDSLVDCCYNLKNITIPNSVTFIGDYMIDSCGVSSIVFEGTMEQWSKVQLGEEWVCSIPVTYVECSDGNVPI